MARSITLVVLTCLVWPAFALASEDQSPYCQPEEGIETLVEELLWYDCIDAEVDCIPKLIDKARLALEDHPESLHPHRAYQDLHRSPWSRTPEGKAAREAMEAPYLARWESDPDDPVATYLYFRILMLEDMEEAHRLLESSTQDHPEFPWGHIGLVATRRAREGADDDSLAIEEHFEKFREICPTRYEEALINFPPFEDEAATSRHLADLGNRLRQDLAQGFDLGALTALQRLWALEFRQTPTEEHDQIRERVKSDLELVEPINATESNVWWRVMKKGFELVGDEDRLGVIEERLQERQPCSFDASSAFIDRLTEELGAFHPEQALAASEEMMLRCPESILLAIWRFSLVEGMDDPSDELILSEFERIVTASEKTTATVRPPPLVGPAGFLISRNLEVERCESILEEELAKLREELEEQPWKRMPEDARERIKQSYRAQEIKILHHLGRARLALGSPDEALQVAATIRSIVEEVRAAPEVGLNLDEGLAAEYWALRGAIAEKQGNLADAFAFHQKAESYPVHLEKTDSSEAERIWQLMGGTEEGLAELESVRPEVEVADEMGPW